MLMLALTVYTCQGLDYRHTEQFCLNYYALESVLQEKRDGKAACSCPVAFRYWNSSWLYLSRK